MRSNELEHIVQLCDTLRAFAAHEMPRQHAATRNKFAERGVMCFTIPAGYGGVASGFQRRETDLQTGPPKTGPQKTGPQKTGPQKFAKRGNAELEIIHPFGGDDEVYSTTGRRSAIMLNRSIVRRRIAHGWR